MTATATTTQTQDFKVLDRDRVLLEVLYNFSEKTYTLASVPSNDNEESEDYTLEYAPDWISVRSQRQYNLADFEFTNNVITINDPLLAVPANLLDHSDANYVICGNTRLKMLNDLIQQNLDKGEVLWVIHPFVVEFTTLEETEDRVQLFRLAKGSNSVQVTTTADRVLQVINFYKVLQDENEGSKVSDLQAITAREFGITASQVASYSKIYEIMTEFPGIGQLVDQKILAITNVVKLFTAFNTFKSENITVPYTMASFLQDLRAEHLRECGLQLKEVPLTEAMINSVLKSKVGLTSEQLAEEEKETHQKKVSTRAKSALQLELDAISKQLKPDLANEYFKRVNDLTSLVMPLVSLGENPLIDEADQQTLSDTVDVLSGLQSNFVITYSLGDAKKITRKLAEAQSDLSKSIATAVKTFEQLTRMMTDQESTDYVKTQAEKTALKKEKEAEKEATAA